MMRIQAQIGIDRPPIPSVSWLANAASEPLALYAPYTKRLTHGVLNFGAEPDHSPVKEGEATIMRNVLVISSAERPVEVLRAALGDDIDELRVVVPDVHQSRLQWLTNADDDARERAAEPDKSAHARADLPVRRCGRFRGLRISAAQSGRLSLKIPKSMPRGPAGSRWCRGGHRGPLAEPEGWPAFVKSDSSRLTIRAHACLGCLGRQTLRRPVDLPCAREPYRAPRRTRFRARTAGRWDLGQRERGQVIRAGRGVCR